MTTNINPNDLKTLAEARDACAALLQSLQEKERQVEALQTDQSAAKSNAGRLESSLKTKDQEIEALRDDLKSAGDRLEKAQKEAVKLSASLKDKDAAIESLQADKSALEKSQKELQAQIDKLKSEAKTAEAKAAQICASVGVEPVKAAPKAEAGAASLLEQFKAIKNPAEQTAFWRKHKNELIKQT